MFLLVCVYSNRRLRTGGASVMSTDMSLTPDSKKILQDAFFLAFYFLEY